MKRKKLIVPYEAEIEFMGDEPSRDVMILGGKNVRTSKKAKSELMRLLKVNKQLHEDKVKYYRKKIAELKRVM